MGCFKGVFEAQFSESFQQSPRIIRGETDMTMEKQPFEDDKMYLPLNMVIVRCRVSLQFAEAQQDLLRSWALEDNFGCTLAWQIGEERWYPPVSSFPWKT